MNNKFYFLVIFIILFLFSNLVFANDGVCTEGDCINGQGTMIFSNGKYVGGWKNGVYDGQAIMVLSHSKRFPNGLKYVGEIKNGEFNGQGTVTSDGDEYVGGFKDDTYEGQGTYTWSNGSKYIGLWENGKPIRGQGTLFAANGKPVQNSQIDWGKVMVGGIATLLAIAVVANLDGSSSDTESESECEAKIESCINTLSYAEMDLIPWKRRDYCRNRVCK